MNLIRLITCLVCLSLAPVHAKIWLDRLNEQGREFFGHNINRVIIQIPVGDDTPESSRGNKDNRDYDPENPESPLSNNYDYVTLDNIAGQGPVVERVRQVIDQFKDPSRLLYFGGKQKVGMLLEGPSGTGKTLLAHAIANELGYTFHNVSASSFVEIYVGQGAQHIRETFEKARKTAPSVLFIDEIDAVASKRVEGSESGGAREYNQSLNELLVQMNSIKPNSGILVITATNMITDLDQAFKSPHRFEIISVPLPDSNGRREILEYYLANLPHVDHEGIAGRIDFLIERTKGFSGAQLADLINTAIQNAVADLSAAEITIEHIEEALETARNAMKTGDFGSETNEYDDVKFTDVVGLEPVIDDFELIVKGLKDPDSLKQYGLHLPKGVLLNGPPGCGKTLLARALANESECPFFYISAASIKDKYVGSSAKRVRDLFEKARRVSPAIIFVDEIDALSESREASNELLTQMDGFTKDANVIVIAATNELAKVDYRARREGRFTQIVEIPLPNEESRHKLIEMYAKKLPNIDLESIPYDNLVLHTEDFNGAAIKELVNEAASFACKAEAEHITKEHFDEALDHMLKLRRQRKNYYRHT